MSELPETDDLRNLPTDSTSKQPDVRRQRELFEQALEFSSKQAQYEFIRQQCQNDPVLGDSVKSLLKLYARESENWLDNNLFETAFVERECAVQPGTIIDRYELIELLGSGGMGTVWLAHQSDPVDRQVAIKLIQPGRETAGFLQRFDAERRALAAMNHPNIAAIYDAGTTSNGQPYFVMELVGGIPLNEYCENADLSIQERLELFLPILKAVEHAHQRGIIHRDLKPSNILVTKFDGQAVPKVIDFGLARALAEGQAEEGGLTQAGALLGTPDYMAPEQARFGRQDVDIRSDVFSLGAMLFETLTTDRLHSDQQYKDAELDAKLQLIRNFEPIRPSVALVRRHGVSDILYADLVPKECAKMLREEVDWIVVKCLENDKERRYQSVGALTEDVHRFLQSKPVSAHPPSKYYVVRKFIRRNRALVATASSVALALILGLAGMSYGLVSANRATKIAIKQKNDASVAREAATLAAKHEKEQREFADAIVDFLKNDFLLLTTVEGQLFLDAENDDLNKDTTLLQLLDRAAAKLRSRDDLDPKVRAELAWTVGASYRLQGDYNQAIEFLTESIEIWRDHVEEMPTEYLNCANSLSVAYGSIENRQMAIDVLEKALARVSNIQQIDPEVKHATFRNLARFYRSTQNHSRARQIIQQVYDDAVERFGDEHRDAVLSLLALARCDQMENKIDSAALRYEKAIGLANKVFGPAHPVTLGATGRYAKVILRFSKRRLEAIDLLKKSVGIAEESLGHHHPYSISLMTDLGYSYWAIDDYEKAIDTFSTLSDRNAEYFGDDHLFVIRAKSNLALNFRDSGQNEKAIQIFESLLGLEFWQEVILQDLADTYLEADRKEAFLELLQDPLSQARTQLSAQPRKLAKLLWHLSVDATACKEYVVAEKLAVESLKVQDQHDPEHWERCLIEFSLATSLFYQGKLEAAKTPLESAYRGLLANRHEHPVVERRLKEVVGSLIVLAKKLDDQKDLAKWTTAKKDLFGSQ